MSGTKLTDKSALAENLNKLDLLMVVDKDDTTGSADGTSKAVQSKYIIQTDKITLNLDLNTSPIILVEAPGVGYFIQPITMTVIYDYGTTDSTVGNNTYIGYDSGSTSNYVCYQRDMIKNISSNITYQYANDYKNGAGGQGNFSIENAPLRMYSTADFGGDGSLIIYVTYQIVKT